MSWERLPLAPNTPERAAPAQTVVERAAAAWPPPARGSWSVADRPRRTVIGIVVWPAVTLPVVVGRPSAGPFRRPPRPDIPPRPKRIVGAWYFVLVLLPGAPSPPPSAQLLRYVPFH